MYRKKAVFLIGLAFANRAVGFVTQLIIARFFGAGPITDLYFFSSFFPQYAYGITSGALSLPFLPQLVRSNASARKKLARVSLLIIAGCGTIAAIILICFPQIIIGNQQNVQQYQSLSVPVALCIAAIVPAALGGFFFMLINARGRHVVPIAISFGVSSILLASVVIAFHFHSVWYLFGGTLVAYSAGMVVSCILAKVFDRDAVNAPEVQPHVMTGAASSRTFVLSIMLCMAETIGFFLNQTLNYHFATLSGPGSVTIYALAYRFTFVGLPIIVAPLSNIMAVQVARTFETRDARRVVCKWVGVTVGLAVIYAALLVAFGPLIVGMAFRGQRFHSADVAHLSTLFLPMGAWLVVFSGNVMMARWLFDQKRGAVYVYGCLAAYFASSILKFFLFPYIGLAGVIWLCVFTEGIACYFFVFTEFGPLLSAKLRQGLSLLMKKD